MLNTTFYKYAGKFKKIYSFFQFFFVLSIFYSKTFYLAAKCSRNIYGLALIYENFCFLIANVRYHKVKN